MPLCLCLCLSLSLSQYIYIYISAKSASAVEYTDCISAECPRYDIKQSKNEDHVMLWSVASNPSLSSYSGPLRTGEVHI